MRYVRWGGSGSASWCCSATFSCFLYVWACRKSTISGRPPKPDKLKNVAEQRKDALSTRTPADPDGHITYHIFLPPLPPPPVPDHPGPKEDVVQERLSTETPVQERRPQNKPGRVARKPAGGQGKTTENRKNRPKRSAPGPAEGVPVSKPVPYVWGR